MTILNIVDKYGSHVDPGAIAINYNEYERETLKKLSMKYSRRYEELCTANQEEEIYLVYIYDDLPKSAKKQLRVNEVDLQYEYYKSGAWKMLCSAYLYPRKRYIDNGLKFSDYDEPARWIDCNEQLPENKCIFNYHEKISNIDIVGKKPVKYFISQKFLIKFKNGDIEFDCRKTDDTKLFFWWDKYKDKTKDIVAWMEIPR